MINISAHHSSTWSPEQRKAAGDKIIDIPFPWVDPHASQQEIETLARKIVNEIIHNYPNKNKNQIIHVMGEMTLTYQLVSFLQSCDFIPVASTTERIKVRNEDGSFRQEFKFVQFRKY